MASDAGTLAVFETVARYQMFHALALIAVAWATTRWSSGSIVAAGWLFVAGTLCFSGSLYAIVLANVRGIGLVTPLGGLLLLAGWAALAWGTWRDER